MKNLKRNPEKISVELVNQLIEQSFGIGFKGNYHFAIGGKVEEGDNLGMVMKKGIFGGILN